MSLDVVVLVLWVAMICTAFGVVLGLTVALRILRVDLSSLRRRRAGAVTK